MECLNPAEITIFHALGFYWPCETFTAMKHKVASVGTGCMQYQSFLRLIIRTGIVSTSLVTVYALQTYFLSAFDIDQRISLFYIPAAVITLSTLTLRFYAIPGIFVGYLVVNLALHGEDLISAVALSATPPLVAAATISGLSLISTRINMFLKPQATLIDVDAYDIFLFCAGYGVINTSLHHILFFLDERLSIPVSPFTALQMMFGDLTGSFLGFIALNLSFSLISRIVRALKPDTKRS